MMDRTSLKDRIWISLQIVIDWMWNLKVHSNESPLITLARKIQRRLR